MQLALPFLFLPVNSFCPKLVSRVPLCFPSSQASKWASGSKETHRAKQNQPGTSKQSLALKTAGSGPVLGAEGPSLKT